MSELLLSKDIELRIVAGETLALIYELAREEDEVSRHGNSVWPLLGVELCKLCL